MARHQPGKKKKREKRLPEPSSYLIASEGKRTEVLYFDGFKDEINERFKGSIQSYEIETHGVGKETLRVIEDIVEYSRRLPILYENIWAVFDKDDFPKDDFDNAIYKAKELDINVAWSNECFELWYLLHFSYSQSALHRDVISEKLDLEFNRLKLGKYDKTSPEIYYILKPKIRTAIKNAQRLDEQTDCSLPPSKRNPNTMVYKLASELLDILERPQ
ncbi:RloB family protein [Enterococcus faecalis]|uniref:RloB family protein n=1 Tax=Enterococcus faecalis TaxID=1351 RepID=UPI002FDC4E34